MIKFKTKNGDTYVYDFDLMTMEQIMAAETFFKLHEKIFRILPGTPTDLSLATEQMALKQAFAALLIKKNSDGTYESYSPNNNNLEALRNLTGIENRKKLEEAKTDFFAKLGNYSLVSMEQLEILLNVIKLLPNTIQNLFYEEMLKTIGEQLGTKLDKNSIQSALAQIGYDKP